jgi:translation initiation factor 1 (eIF-1/SUI1)
MADSNELRAEVSQSKTRPALQVADLGKRVSLPSGELIILEGFPKGGFDLDAFARDLKRRLGTGGAVKGFTIELQGDHRDALEIALREHGFKSKRAGG